MRRTRTPRISDPRSPMPPVLSSRQGSILRHLSSTTGLNPIGKSRIAISTYAMHSTPEIPKCRTPTPRDLSPRVLPRSTVPTASGNRRSRFQYASVSQPGNPDASKRRLAEIFRHVSLTMNGPKRSSGNRGSRFLDARFLRPRKPRYPDGLNPDAPWLLDTCSVDQRLRSFLGISRLSRL
jgi:hypothetical protein